MSVSIRPHVHIFMRRSIHPAAMSPEAATQAPPAASGFLREINNALQDTILRRRGGPLGQHIFHINKRLEHWQQGIGYSLDSDTVLVLEALCSLSMMVCQTEIVDEIENAEQSVVFAVH